MKLKSGHRVIELEKEKNEEQQRLFKAYSQGMIKLEPGNWFYTKAFLDYADRYYEFQFKPTDTLIMTFPKCGTTWMQEILWNMKHPSNLDNPILDVSVNTRCPFIEGDFISATPNISPLTPESDTWQYFEKYCPGKKFADGVYLQLADNLPEPRIFKTHLPFSLLNPSLLDTCKVVFVVRNPKDVCLSYYYHCRIIKAQDYTGDFDTFFKLFISDEVLYGPYWKFLEDGWKRKDHPNFHLAYFEEMKSDPVKEISALNDFLGTGLNDQIIKKVAEETTFEVMKQRDPFSGGVDRECGLIDKSKGDFFRSGTVESWKKTFSKEQNQIIDEWITKNSSTGNNFHLKYSL